MEQKKTELSLLLFIASIETKSAVSPKVYTSALNSFPWLWHNLISWETQPLPFKDIPSLLQESHSSARGVPRPFPAISSNPSGQVRTFCNMTSLIYFQDLAGIGSPGSPHLFIPCKRFCNSITWADPDSSIIFCLFCFFCFSTSKIFVTVVLFSFLLISVTHKITFFQGRSIVPWYSVLFVCIYKAFNLIKTIHVCPCVCTRTRTHTHKPSLVFTKLYLIHTLKWHSTLIKYILKIHFPLYLFLSPHFFFHFFSGWMQNFHNRLR